MSRGFPRLARFGQMGRAGRNGAAARFGQMGGTRPGFGGAAFGQMGRGAAGVAQASDKWAGAPYWLTSLLPYRPGTELGLGGGRGGCGFEKSDARHL